MDTNQTYTHTIRCKHHYQTNTWTQTKHTNLRNAVSITIEQAHGHKPNIQTYDTLLISLSNKHMYTNQTYKHTIRCKHHYQTSTWTQTKHTNIRYVVSITIKHTKDTKQTYKHKIRCKHHYQTNTCTQTKHTNIRCTVSITIKQTHAHKPNTQTYDTL